MGGVARLRRRIGGRLFGIDVVVAIGFVLFPVEVMVVIAVVGRTVVHHDMGARPEGAGAALLELEGHRCPFGDLERRPFIDPGVQYQGPSGRPGVRLPDFPDVALDVGDPRAACERRTAQHAEQ